MPRIEPTTVQLSQGLLDTISAVYYACAACGTYCLAGELTEADEEYLCLDCENNQAKVKVYQTPALPLHWIVELVDDKQLFMVPANQYGWRKRKPYQGNHELQRLSPVVSLTALSSSGFFEPAEQHDSLLDTLRRRNRRNQ